MRLHCATCLTWGLDPTGGVSAVHYETGRRQTLRPEQLTSEAFDEHRAASGEQLDMIAATMLNGTVYCTWHLMRALTDGRGRRG